MEDRQRQQREENAHCEEEAAHREEGLAWECCWHEEEIRQQMDLLRGLVEGVWLQGMALVARADKDHDIKLTKLTNDDDIEDYLTIFE